MEEQIQQESRDNIEVAQLTELPKAEKIFKEYVGGHINHLIGQSQDLADKYIKERDSILDKKKENRKSRREIEKMVLFLEKVMNIPQGVRNNSPQFGGMTDLQIEQSLQNYKKLQQMYQKQQIDEQEQYQDEQTEQGNKKSSPKPLLQKQNEKDPYLKDKKLNKDKRIACFLSVLQIITYLLVVIAIIYRILF